MVEIQKSFWYKIPDSCRKPLLSVGGRTHPALPSRCGAHRQQLCACLYQHELKALICGCRLQRRLASDGASPAAQAGVCRARRARARRRSSRTSRRASCGSTRTTSTGTTACCRRPGRTRSTTAPTPEASACAPLAEPSDFYFNPKPDPSLPGGRLLTPRFRDSIMLALLN